MKIIFICGCLEQGKDGVGDYTRRFAAELIRQGHVVGLIAFNDNFLSEQFSGIQQVDGCNIPVLRIPGKFTSSQRSNEVKSRLTDFAPQWVSLQFVPYSFHRRGIPVFLYKELLSVGSQYHWHIMFHELWVGTQPFDFKNKVYAWLQKRSIINLVKFLKPGAIHTHLPLYVKQLNNLGVKAKLLPLFSNIAVHKSEVHVVESNVFRIGFFSQAQIDDKIIHFLENLNIELDKRKRELQIVLIGSKDGKVNKAAAALKANDVLAPLITSTGFLNDQKLSEALQACNLGITSVYRHGLGKSGSVAAFIAHGVPVAAPRTHIDYKADEIGFSSEELRASVVLEVDLDEIELKKGYAQLAARQIQPSVIVKSFLSNL